MHKPTAPSAVWGYLALLVAALVGLLSLLIGLLGWYAIGFARGIDGPGNPAAVRHLTGSSLVLVLGAAIGLILAIRYAWRREHLPRVVLAGIALLALSVVWWSAGDCVINATGDFWRCYTP